MRKLTLLICALVFITNLYAQEKSIAVDVQTPGLLSSLLTYPQQQSVEELTVTGYINRADMNFINGLIQNRNLRILNLGNVNLAVTSYGDNIVWYGFLSFGDEKELQKFIMPRNISGIYRSNYADRKAVIVSRVDTLIINNQDLSVFGPQNADNISWIESSYVSYYSPNYLILTEGVEVIPAYAFSFISATGSNPPCRVTLSNTIKIIGGGAFCGCSFENPLIFPNSIEYLGRHPLYYDQYNFYYGDASVNMWWSTNTGSNNLPISPTRFDFPKNLKYYNSFGGSKNNVYVADNYTSDTITVYEQCDTLIARLNAKIAYFYPQKPFYSYRSYNNIAVDTLYVPENCGEIYTNHFRSNLQEGKIKAIKEMMAVQSIEVFGPSDKCYVGEELQLNVMLTPSDAFDKRVVWSSQNPEIATVDNNGLVKGIKAGETIIVATSVENDSIKGLYNLQVLQHVDGITLNITEATIWNGDTIRITPIISPEDASNQNVEWKSNDQSVAIVDDGIVKGKSAGFATITCTTEDGQFSAKCNITVKQQVESVRLSQHSLTINVGKSEQIVADIYPANATDKSLIWESSNNEIATVDNGLIKALKTGEVWIKATSTNNENVSDSCLVTVLQPVTGIMLNFNNYELHQIGETVQLVATVLPEDASNREVNWASSNESICIVSNGTVVAVGFGTCVIIATSTDGNFIATCTINVILDLPCDVNHDGEVNIADINAIIDIILGGDVNDDIYSRADVNNDGEINIADVNAVIDAILSN